MSEKRFTLNLMKKPSEIEMDGKMISKYDVVRLLNEQQATISALKEENEQLRTQLLICQQSKSDDGRFQVWEVPPITMGKRISFTTNNGGEKDE